MEKINVKNSRPALRNKAERLEYIDSLEVKLQESIDKNARQDSTISRLTREAEQSKIAHDNEIKNLKKLQEDEVKGLNAKISHLSGDKIDDNPKKEQEDKLKIPYEVLEAMYKERSVKVQEFAEVIESLLDITSDTSAALKGIITLSDNNIRSIVDHELNKNKKIKKGWTRCIQDTKKVLSIIMTVPIGVNLQCLQMQKLLK